MNNENVREDSLEQFHSLHIQGKELKDNFTTHLSPKENLKVEGLRLIWHTQVLLALKNLNNTFYYETFTNPEEIKMSLREEQEASGEPITYTRFKASLDILKNIIREIERTRQKTRTRLTIKQKSLFSKNAQWENITFRFLNQEELIIIYQKNNKQHSTTCGAMGCADTRGKSNTFKPTNAWRMLRVMGHHQDTLPREYLDKMDPKERNILQVQQQLLSKALRNYIGIDSKPLVSSKFHDDFYYRSRFHIMLEADLTDEDRYRETAELLGHLIPIDTIQNIILKFSEK